ncbi:MAG TPA: helix-turn-helix domain-containing protein [Planctomycetota bacterium]|nr:helix-turn-helix domain-containing protein [Planctomycetota bacterium]
MEDFASLLVAARERIGITQAQLAVSAGLTPSYVCLLESGKKPPPSDRVCERLAEVLGVPARQLLEVAHFQRSPTTVQKRVRTLRGRLTREQRSRQRVLESLLPPFLFSSAPSWIEGTMEWIGGTALRKRRLREVLSALGRRHQDRATAVSRLVDELPERDRRLLLEALPRILGDRAPGRPPPPVFYSLPPAEEAPKSPFLLVWTGPVLMRGEIRDGDQLLVDPGLALRPEDVLLLRGPDGAPLVRRLGRDGALVPLDPIALAGPSPGASTSEMERPAGLANTVAGVVVEVRRPLRRPGG